MVPVEDVGKTALGGPARTFVIVKWVAEVGDHWIAPLHLHHQDHEAWCVLRGSLGFLLGDDEFVASPNSGVPLASVSDVLRIYAAASARALSRAFGRGR
jgi:hypothetical protein